MDLAEPGEESKEGGPNTDEEDENEDEDFPFREIGAPQEGPIFPVGLGKEGLGTTEVNRSSCTHPAQPVIAQHQREEEPQHEPTTEKRIVKVGYLWWRLTVVLCVQS